MKQQLEYHTLYRLITPVSYGAGLIVGAFGILALIGWYTGIYILVQLSSKFAPMQYNTALGFIFFGLSLLTIIKLPRLSAILSFLVFLIGAMTLLQYVFNVDIGIDQVFMKSMLLVATSYPGRMAPNTALCLMLGSAASFCNLDIVLFRGKRFFAIAFSALTLALGFMALIGYVADLPAAYGWGKLTGMNIISAFCFTMAGIGLVALSLRYFLRELTGKNFIPIMVIVMGCFFFLLLWQSLVADQNKKMIMEVHYDAVQIKDEIDKKLIRYNLSLSHMEKRIENRDYFSKPEWLYDAHLFLSDMDAYQAIAWIPTEANPAWSMVNDDISMASKNKQRLEYCLDQARVKPTGSNFIIAASSAGDIDNFCMVRNSSKGFLIALLNTKTFLKDAIDNSSYAHYQIHLSKNNRIQTIRPAAGQLLPTEWASVLPLAAIDERLQLSVWPTQSYLDERRSIFPIIALIVGSLLTLLLALALRFWLVANMERKELAEAIRWREGLYARFQAITVSANDAIMMLDAEARIVFWNQAAIQIFGYAADEAIGKFYYDLIIPPRYIEAQKIEFSNFLKSGEDAVFGKNFEIIAIKKNGTEFPMEISVATATINKKWEGVVVMRDITERKKSNATIQHQANYDALTDLPNRTLFRARLALSLSHAERLRSWVALLSMDLDGFKAVNDQLGHDAGDALLIQVGHRLLQCIRETDTVTRLGGDEFAVILTNIHRKEEIMAVAQKILDQLSKPYTINNKEIVITASLGIAIYPVDTTDQKDLLIKADQAMYRAKNAGKNRVC